MALEGEVRPEFEGQYKRFSNGSYGFVEDLCAKDPSILELVGSELTRDWQTYCQLKQYCEPPPFEGGQCSIPYVVAYNYGDYLETGRGQMAITGPITAVGVGEQGNEYVPYITNARGQFAFRREFKSRGYPERVRPLVATEGIVDNCGDPPTTCYPPAPYYGTGRYTLREWWRALGGAAAEYILGRILGRIVPLGAGRIFDYKRKPAPPPPLVFPGRPPVRPPRPPAKPPRPPEPYKRPPNRPPVRPPVRPEPRPGRFPQKPYQPNPQPPKPRPPKPDRRDPRLPPPWKPVVRPNPNKIPFPAKPPAKPAPPPSKPWNPRPVPPPQRRPVPPPFVPPPPPIPAPPPLKDPLTKPDRLRPPQPQPRPKFDPSYVPVAPPVVFPPPAVPAAPPFPGTQPTIRPAPSPVPVPTVVPVPPPVIYPSPAPPLPPGYNPVPVPPPVLVPVPVPVPVPIPVYPPYPVPVPVPVTPPPTKYDPPMLPPPVPPPTTCVCPPTYIYVTREVPVMIPGPPGKDGKDGQDGKDGTTMEFVNTGVQIASCSDDGAASTTIQVPVLQDENGQSNAELYKALFNELRKLRVDGRIVCSPPPGSDGSGAAWSFTGTSTAEAPVWISPIPLASSMVDVAIELLGDLPDSIRYYVLAGEQTEMGVGSVSFVDEEGRQYAPFTQISTRMTRIIRPRFADSIPIVYVRLSLKPGISFRVFDPDDYWVQ